MQENDQRATILQLVDKFKIKIKELGGSTHMTPELKKEELEKLIVQLIIDHVLKEEFQHTAYSTNAYATIGPLWRQVLQGSRVVKLEISSERRSNCISAKSAKRILSPGLEIKLDELRKEISSSAGGMFPHAVLSAQQISILSAQKPTSVEQLEKLIGKLKTEKYGSRIINLIQQYIKSQLDTDEQEVTRGNERGKKRPRNGAPIFVESSEEEA